MDKFKNVVIGALVVALLLSGFLYLKATDRLGGITYSKEDFPQGLFAGRGRQFEVSNVGVLTSSGAMTQSGAFTATGESRINRVRNTGSVLTIATTSVGTLTGDQFCDNGLVIFPDWAGVASSTAILNLPSFANAITSCLSTDGDEFTFWIYNEASAAASTTLIVAGASTTLTGLDSNADVLNGGNKLLVTVSRASSTQMTVDLVEKTDAD